MNRRQFLQASIAALSLFIPRPARSAGLTVLYIPKAGSCGQLLTAPALTETMLTDSWYTVILPDGANVSDYAASLAGLECRTTYLPLVKKNSLN